MPYLIKAANTIVMSWQRVLMDAQRRLIGVMRKLGEDFLLDLSDDLPVQQSLTVQLVNIVSEGVALVQVVP